MRGWTRYLWWLLGLGLVAALLVVALHPQVTAVDTTTAVRGPMTVTIDEEGETRIRRRFMVSAPVTGRVERIDLEPGDAVVANTTVVARIRAEAPPLLDARTRTELQASLSTARSTLGQARAEEQRARSARDQAERELARERELDKGGLTTRQAVETRETNLQAAEESLKAATFAVAAASSEVTRIEARLRPDVLEASGRLLTVTSPVSGVVLRRLRESAAVVPAGEPLVEVGDPSNLEVVADLLSTDAVQVADGAVVRLERWGGDDVLTGRVRRVEPSGFMKISALGVEEQRVNVVIDLDDRAAAATRLGDGYRTEVRIVTWEADDVVQVPLGALFRRGDQWSVFVIDGDVAHATTVEIGHRNGEMAEVVSGLTAGTEVVLHPPDTLADQATVQKR